MLSQTIFSKYNIKFKKGLMNFELACKVYLSLICFVGLFSASSFAQPLASKKNKFVGNVITNGNSIRSNFTKYWNQVTAENAGKWGSVEGTPGNYNWTQLDNIYNFSKNNGLPYKHHTLIWGAQQPGFLASMDSAQQYEEVENWIKATGERYPDAYQCEVVNEPLHQPPVYKDALGGDGETGWDWVIKAFELTRQYWSPNTKLLINEYSVINDGTSNTNYIKIINLLKERGLVDGIGVQGHNFEVNGGASTTTLKNNLDKLAATGLPVYITEFDINEADDNTQLQKYQSIFPTLYEHPGVYGITLWGYIQSEIWQTDAYLLESPRFDERPAMQWLRTYLLSPFKPTLISPLFTNDEEVNTTLIWTHSDSATSYNVQISSNRNFTVILIDSTVSDTSFYISNLSENTIYYWRVNASNEYGTSDYSPFASFTTETTTDIKGTESLQVDYKLYQNYPNPFNPSTQINYYLPEEAKANLNIYDALGRHIITLVSSEQSAGQHSVIFIADNLSSGIYFYKLTADSYIEVKQMLLMK